LWLGTAASLGTGDNAARSSVATLFAVRTPFREAKTGQTARFAEAIERNSSNPRMPDQIGDATIVMVSE
jgi:hypothetical protein